MSHRVRTPRGLPALAAALALWLCGAAPAWAQAAGATSLNDLVLDWMRGNYASPLVCKIEGRAQRGLRRILIGPSSAKKQPAETRVRFVDLDAANASRCFTEIGGTSPNITGELVVRHPITKLRDTAVRDFKVALRRQRGYELEILSGRLLLREIGVVDAAPESLDFRHGRMRIQLLRPGSDALRLLADLPSPRKVMLEFETREGRRLKFPASLAKPQRSERGSSRR